MDNLKLIELICTRINHDVIGNIGAVANAVELLEEGDMDFLDDIKNILKISSTNLSARMKFFRIAFGLENSNLENIDFVNSTTQNYLDTLGNPNQKIILNYDNFSPKLSKIIMISTMVLADIFIKAGEIHTKQSDKELIIYAQSDNLFNKNKIENIKNIFNNKDCDNMAQMAPVFYLKNITNELGINIEITEDNNFGFKFY